MNADWLVAAAAVTGSALMALGAIGLVRFPDVFTRMHAATKAATVGVITTTAAAALEAGPLSGVLALLLVIALLFLSGPLGMSLLARAAYHDPETPRHAATRDLDRPLPISESTGAVRTGGAGAVLALWLLLVWIALFGAIRPNVLAGGAAVAVLLTIALRSLAPRWPYAILHPAAAVRFAAYFASRLVAGTWDVIRTLFLPTEHLRPGVVEAQLHLATRNEITLLMNAISFTPGTVALELHDDRVYLHVLHLDDPAAIRTEVEELQRRIAAAFARPPSRHGRGPVTRAR